MSGVTADVRAEAAREDGMASRLRVRHRVAFFGKLAEIAGEYLKKGSQVYVEGRLQTRKWQDKDGRDRYTTEIVGEKMQMLSPKGEGGGRQGGGRAGGEPVYEDPAGFNADDDIPF